jgi:hypothetical protein
MGLVMIFQLAGEVERMSQQPKGLWIKKTEKLYPLSPFGVVTLLQALQPP